MKKIIFIIVAIVSFALTGNVYAGSNNISVKSSSSVTIGNTLSVTVTVSSNETLGSWVFVVGYDTSKLTFVSSDCDNNLKCADASGNSKSQSYNFKFKAKETGSAKIYIDNATYYSLDEKKESISLGSKTVTVTTKPTNTVTNYSKNNYLSSLSIENHELSPAFNKDTLEYTVILPKETYEINVEGKLEDKKAKVSGLGNITLTDGENKISIKVTAENGNVRTYIINATVEEAQPINVNIDNKEYTVIRKKDNLEIPNNYKETTTTIEGENVLAFFGEITEYTLVALKDNEGNICWAIYDLNENKYTIYKELKFNSSSIYPLSLTEDKILEGYTKDSMTIAGATIEVLRKTNCYPIIYGKNLDTSEISYYEYDAKENTVQRYNEEETKSLKKEKEKYFYCTIGLGAFAIFELIIILFVVIHKNKKNSKKLEKTLAKTIKIDIPKNNE